MVNTEIKLIIFFAAKDGEALYSQQKQDWELTVAQIVNSLLPRQIGNGQTGDGKSECRHSRNQGTKWPGMGEFNSR